MKIHGFKNKTNPCQNIGRYSLVGVVLPNTEELIREQILVNKSDKSDHPHQWEPWCFVEVVNKVGAETMPTHF